MNGNTQEFRAVSGSNAQRTPSSAANEQTAARGNTDEHEAEIRSVAVLGYN
jgi:hypothetical protein